MVGKGWEVRWESVGRGGEVIVRGEGEGTGEGVEGIEDLGIGGMRLGGGRD